MTEPKQNWTIQDAINAADINRIAGNLNAVSTAWGQPTQEYTPSVITDYDVGPLYNQIAAHYNALAPIAEYPAIQAPRTYPFVYIELNRIEQLCALEYVWAHIPLLDSDRRQMVDRDGLVIFAGNTEKNTKEYVSTHAGSQIDWFVDQIKEWNNGEL